VHPTLPLRLLAGVSLVALTAALLVLMVRTLHILFNDRSGFRSCAFEGKPL